MTPRPAAIVAWPILYEPNQNEVYTFNGKGKSATVFDANSGKVTLHTWLGNGTSSMRFNVLGL